MRTVPLQKEAPRDIAPALLAQVGMSKSVHYKRIIYYESFNTPYRDLSQFIGFLLILAGVLLNRISSRDLGRTFMSTTFIGGGRCLWGRSFVSLPHSVETRNSRNERSGHCPYRDRSGAIAGL